MDIGGVKPEDEISSATLLLKLGTEVVTMLLRTRRLHWYGYVMCRGLNHLLTASRTWLPLAQETAEDPGKRGLSASEKT